MILTTHALTGAVIGKNLGSPWLIIPAALALHFLLDTFRHGEYLNEKSKITEFWKVALDIFIGLSVLWVVIFWADFSPAIIFNILLGAFFSMFPDLTTFLYWKLNFKFLKPLFDFHHRIHHCAKNPAEEKWTLRNFANDAIACATAIIILLLR